MNPTISVILPTFRRWDYVLDTVADLWSQTHVPDEIVIVDQTPPPELPPHALAELWKTRQNGRLVYAHMQIPHVYRARNLGAKLASSELLLYLDDDIRANPDLIRRHLDCFQDGHVDAVVGRVTTPGIDRSQHPAPPVCLSPTEQAFTFGRYRDDVPLDRIAYCVAGNLCIRRSVLAALGGWDEYIRTYGDKDLGLRLHAAGRHVVYEPCAEILHLVAERGGTRLADPASPWPAWQRAASIQYVAFRHLRGRERWKYGFQRAAQHTFLLKRHAVRPWRWVPEFIGFLAGSAVAYLWSRRRRKDASISVRRQISIESRHARPTRPFDTAHDPPAPHVDSTPAT